MAETSINVIDAIYSRRAVRDYLPQKVDQTIIRLLLDAAVHAPTAMHEEPCTFVVVQNKNLLNRLSDSIQQLMRVKAQSNHSVETKHLLDFVNQSNFNAFYNASTLIVIYCKFQGQFVAADCWLAAENLMLAAVANGLGSCVIGLSVDALNTPEWKAELGVPAEMAAIAPIIIGMSAGEVKKGERKEPEIIAWK